MNRYKLAHKEFYDLKVGDTVKYTEEFLAKDKEHRGWHYKAIGTIVRINGDQSFYDYEVNWIIENGEEYHYKCNRNILEKINE